MVSHRCVCAKRAPEYAHPFNGWPNFHLRLPGTGAVVKDFDWKKPVPLLRSILGQESLYIKVCRLCDVIRPCLTSWQSIVSWMDPLGQFYVVKTRPSVYLLGTYLRFHPTVTILDAAEKQQLFVSSASASCFLCGNRNTHLALVFGHGSNQVHNWIRDIYKSGWRSGTYFDFTHVVAS